MHVHLLDRHLFLVLLGHHSLEFRCQRGFEQVHFDEVEHHGPVLPFEGPEGLVGDAMVNVVERIRGDSSIAFKALLHDSNRSGDLGEQLVCGFVRLHGQVC